MGADDDGEDAEPDSARIPACVAGAAVEVQEFYRIHSAHVEDAHLAIRREAVVAGTHRMGGTDLDALLSEDRAPQT